MNHVLTAPRKPLRKKDDFVGFLFGNSLLGSFWAVPLLMLGLAFADFLCWIAAGMQPGAIDTLLCLNYLKQQAIFPDAIMVPIVAHMFVGTLAAMLGLMVLQPLGWLTSTLSLMRNDPWWPLFIGFAIGHVYSLLLWFSFQWGFASEVYTIHIPYFFVFAIPCVVAGVSAAIGAFQWKKRNQDDLPVPPELKAFSEL